MIMIESPLNHVVMNGVQVTGAQELITQSSTYLRQTINMESTYRL